MSLTRMFVAVMAVLAGAAALAAAAAADPPTKFLFTDVAQSDILRGVCAFDVRIDSVDTIAETDFVDSSGTLNKALLHVTEQDTFSARGKTLVGVPFRFNLDVRFGPDGNVTAVLAEGNVENVPLPDGSSFHTAGRVDFLAHPGDSFRVTPDNGNFGNLAGFCAALA